MDKDCHGKTAQCAGKTFSEDCHARLERARKEAAEDATLRQEEVPLTFGGKKYTGWMAWCEGRTPAPLILIVHNYAGLKTYDKDQAAYLARSGFAALAVDMFGDEAVPAAVRIKTEENASDHFGLAFNAMNDTLRDQFLIRGLLSAWLEKGRAHPSVEEAGRAAAIGYCYGGMLMFDIVRAGIDIDLVVSFHGIPQSNPLCVPFLYDPETFDSSIKSPENTYENAAKVRVLVENGDADDYVSNEGIAAWKKEMDAAGVDWMWHDHARTPHGFALAPDISTEYTESADRRSTRAMWAMIKESWPDAPIVPIELNACGTVIHPKQ